MLANRSTVLRFNNALDKMQESIDAVTVILDRPDIEDAAMYEAQVRRFEKLHARQTRLLDKERQRAASKGYLW